MSEEKVESKGVTVPKLTKTDPESYLSWRKMFQGFLAVKGGKYAMSKEGFGYLPECWCEHQDVSIPESVEPDKAKREEKEKKTKMALKSNDLAMAYFNLALQHNRAKMCIDQAISEEYPDGKAKLLMERLDLKFRPNTGYECELLRDKLRKIQCKENDDPNDVFDKIAGVRNLARELGGTALIDDAEIVARLFTIMPKMYHPTMDWVMRAAKDKGEKVDLDRMEKEIIDYYLMFKPKKGISEEDGVETALSSFTGKCYNCGKTGHRAFQCKEGNNDSESKTKKGGKENRNCHLCGKKGHIRADCFELEKNKDKRPKNWKSCLEDKDDKKEKAAAIVLDREIMLTFVDTNESIEESEDAKKDEAEASVLEKNDEERKMIEEKIEEDEPKELVLLSNDSNELDDDELWVADSGATICVKKNTSGVIETRKAKARDNVKGNSGDGLSPEVIGTVKLTQVDKNGNEGQDITLTNVYCSKKYNYNLFSLTKAMEAGWNLESEKDCIMLKKGKQIIKFDVKVKSPNGVLYCGRFRANHSGGASEASLVNSNVKDKSIRKMNINEAHCCFGHMSEANTRKVAKEMGIEIVRGAMKKCAACAVGKSKQKNVPKNKDVQKESIVPGERIHLDLSKINAPEEYKDLVQMTRPWWRLMVDEATGLKFSEFFETKRAMIEPTCSKLHLWKSNGIAIKNIRMDNAGENK